MRTDRFVKSRARRFELSNSNQSAKTTLRSRTKAGSTSSPSTVYSIIADQAVKTLPMRVIQGRRPQRECRVIFRAVSAGASPNGASTRRASLS